MRFSIAPTLGKHSSDFGRNLSKNSIKALGFSSWEFIIGLKHPAICHHFAGDDVYIICFGIHHGKHRHGKCGWGYSCPVIYDLRCN